MIIVNTSRPNRGVSVQHLQMRGGERWPVGCAGDAAQVPATGGPSRFVPAHQSVRHWAPLAVAAGMVRSVGRRLSPRAVDRRPANPKGEARSPEMVSPPGAMRSKPTNTRARNAGRMADLRIYSLRQTSMSRGVEARGSPGTLAFRAPLLFKGAHRLDDGLPGAAKEHGR